MQLAATKTLPDRSGGDLHLHLPSLLPTLRDTQARHNSRETGALDFMHRFSMGVAKPLCFVVSYKLKTKDLSLGTRDSCHCFMNVLNAATAEA